MEGHCKKCSKYHMVRLSDEQHFAPFNPKTQPKKKAKKVPTEMKRITKCLDSSTKSTSQQAESSGVPSAMNGNNGTTPRKEHPEEQEVIY